MGKRGEGLIMEKLKSNFTKNGLPYHLINRNDHAALYGVGGIYFPDVYHYEVIRIIQVPDSEMFGRMVPAHEAIPSNQLFGSEGSRCIVDRNQADAYFDELTKKLTPQKEPVLSTQYEENRSQVGSSTTQTSKSLT